MKFLTSKIYSREALIKILEPLQKAGKKVGVTNGVFDILHAGHVIYLEQAKKACDILVVSLNTDTSVKEYKDSQRPIVSEQDRALVVAALESVDYVTFHNERRMRTTLEILKPHYYIKAADYDESTLTSSDVLKEWGGEPLFIPLVKGKSTTHIIEKIRELYCEQPVGLPIEQISEKNRAVILDRDGVINKEIEYLHEPEKFTFLPHALEGIKNMYDMGFQIVIITTQAGIGLGYFTKEDFFKVNKKMLQGFHAYGIVISKIYFCPHSVKDNCNCRKPKTGLFERAKNDLNLDMQKSWLIGDKTSDIQAGKDMECHTILVTSGHAGKDKQHNATPDFTVNNLNEAADTIKKYKPELFSI